MASSKVLQLRIKQASDKQVTQAAALKATKEKIAAFKADLATAKKTEAVAAKAAKEKAAAKEAAKKK